MKIIIKNTTELLSTLYGDEEDYSYITLRDLKEIIDEKLESLEKIYDYIGDNDVFDNENTLYDLGDCMNLIELFKHARIERSDK